MVLQSPVLNPLPLRRRDRDNAVRRPSSPHGLKAVCVYLVSA